MVQSLSSTQTVVAIQPRVYSVLKAKLVPKVKLVPLVLKARPALPVPKVKLVPPVL